MPVAAMPHCATAMAAVPIEGVDQSGFGMRAGLASAVAWAPNPNNPPFYVDWPIRNGSRPRLMSRGMVPTALFVCRVESSR